MQGEGICTPFIDGHTLYYGYHKGKQIWSIDLEIGEEKIEFALEDSECYGHISSPAIYGNAMIYHGPWKGGGQKSFVAAKVGGKWMGQNSGPCGPPYMRQGPGSTWFAKNRGIVRFASFLGKQVVRMPGPFRHCHYHDGWWYYSQWGAEEYIKRMKDGIVEDFHRPDIKYLPTSSGPARHRMEVRDPFINDEYFACVANGEQEIQVWKL